MKTNIKIHFDSAQERLTATVSFEQGKGCFGARQFILNKPNNLDIDQLKSVYADLMEKIAEEIKQLILPEELQSKPKINLTSDSSEAS